jgi:hypothetical protein
MLNATTAALRLSELALKPQSELGQYFSTLPSATSDQLAGHAWIGKLYAPIKVEKMPALFQQTVATTLNTALNPWKGKTFKADGTGANLWLWGQQFGQYTMLEQESPVDQQPCLWLDYNVVGNPALLRRIRGEVRVLGKNQFLARMNWLTNNRIYCVAYFSLSSPTTVSRETQHD